MQKKNQYVRQWEYPVEKTLDFPKKFPNNGPDLLQSDTESEERNGVTQI